MNDLLPLRMMVLSTTMKKIDQTRKIVNPLTLTVPFVISHFKPAMEQEDICEVFIT